MSSASDVSLDRARVAFGCCPLGGYGWSDVDVHEVQRAIRFAFDEGIGTFDTADVYGFGLSESRLAEALCDRRHSALIVTKVGLRWSGDGVVIRDGSPTYLRGAVEASLRRLQLEAIPVVLLHWPDPHIPVAESLGALQELQREGKVLRYGASNLDHFDPPVLWSQHRVSLLTGRLRSELRGTECAMAWGSLEQGLLAGERRSREALDSTDRRQRLPIWEQLRRSEVTPLLRILDRVAAELGTTSMALAVRWVLDRGGVDIVAVGCKSRDHVASLLRGADRSIDPSQHDLVAFEAERTRQALDRTGS